MKRGIYLVANLNSETLCHNLIYSIRASGCSLPIRLIHFGGKKITSKAVLDEVEFLELEDFSAQALDFVTKLRQVLHECPAGFLNRFLPFFSDWDEFIYSDNDVVALTNWEELFEFSKSYDIVHADEEYTTNGKYNFNQPGKIKEFFGEDAIGMAITAGHFMARKGDKMIRAMEYAMEWFRMHPGVCKLHDQAFLHIAALVGGWNILNLCKAPNNWLSTWAGDYNNNLSLIHALQAKGGNCKINHIHYSGGTPQGLKAIEDLLLSDTNNTHRLKTNMLTGVKYYSGYFYGKTLQRKIKRKLKTLFA